MGMFDDIVVKVPLPDMPAGFEPAFQTKSLVRFLDNYEIREDGTLWHEQYDTEDRSDPNATGLMAFAGMWSKVNPRWVQETDFTGEVEFHDWMADAALLLSYSAYFVEGQMHELHRRYPRQETGRTAP